MHLVQASFRHQDTNQDRRSDIHVVEVHWCDICVDMYVVRSDLYVVKVHWCDISVDTYMLYGVTYTLPNFIVGQS